MNKRRYPEWALPKLRTVGLDYRSVRGILGGQARVRNLSPERLHRIAMKGYRAYLAKLTPEERSDRARAAGALGNQKRWDGHVKKPAPERKTRGWNAAQAGMLGAIARWGSKGERDD